MFSFIFNFFENLLYVALFIVFIPGFFFTLPPESEKIVVVAVHGLLYSFAFMLLHIMFSTKRIAKCAISIRG